MKLSSDTVRIRAEVVFLMFALLIGLRDVGSEWILRYKPSEEAACLAFVICATITVLSLLLLLLERGLPELLRKLSSPRVMSRVAVVSISASVVYYVTFKMVGDNRIGAGLFNLFDYGLSPILTGVLGIVIFRNILTPRLLAATVIFVVGILLLYRGTDTSGDWSWVAVAVLSPVGTSISDATSKWLLSPEGGKMSRAELLFVRFLPATALIGIWIVANGGTIHVHHPTATIPLAIFCGFLPLWLLCTVLGRSSLTKYAVWEFLIPGVAFFGTLQFHPENLSGWRITGALVIASAVVSHELKLPSRLKPHLGRGKNSPGKKRDET